MNRNRTVWRAAGWSLTAHLALFTAMAWAQGPPAALVGVTEARQYPVRQALKLSGSVSARHTSVVASEVAGLVTELVARAGDAVAKGAPLVRLRRQHLDLDLARVEAELKEAEARLELANNNLRRFRELFDSQVISRQQLDDAISEDTAWQGRAESLRAQRARVQDDLDQSTVKAPFAGVVVVEHTQVGEWLGVGDPVLEMVSLDELEAVLEVPERYFSSLRLGTPATVTFDSIPGLEVVGKVGAIVPQADAKSRTFPVKVRLPNRERRIAVGMLAQVAFVVGEAYDATVLPKDAVVRRGGSEVVLRVGEGSQVEVVPVETGSAVGSWVEVRGAVAPGQTFVTRGNERLQPGQTVQVQPVEYELP